jgi:hypothetical protein
MAQLMRGPAIAIGHLLICGLGSAAPLFADAPTGGLGLTGLNERLATRLGPWG